MKDDISLGGAAGESGDGPAPVDAKGLRITLEQDEDGDWIARVVDTPALCHGDTPDQAVARVLTVHRQWQEWERQGYPDHVTRPDE